jgi:hypothetical protein
LRACVWIRTRVYALVRHDRRAQVLGGVAACQYSHVVREVRICKETLGNGRDLTIGRRLRATLRTL